MASSIVVKDRGGNFIGIAEVDPQHVSIQVKLVSTRGVGNLLNALVLEGEMGLEVGN